MPSRNKPQGLENRGFYAHFGLLESGGGTATVSETAKIDEELLSTGQHGSATQNFINEAYRDLLGRPADSTT